MRSVCSVAGTMLLLGAIDGYAVENEVFGDGFDGFDLTACDNALPVDPTAPAQLAAALDLCQTTTESDTAPGLISATLTLADGTGTPNAKSRAIRASYGSGIAPQRGSKLVLLSTGSAAGASDTNYVAPQPGFGAGTQSALPADWVARHPPSCPPPSGAEAHDPVMLKLRIRVPNNAQSFSLDVNFLTADFPENVCSSFVDQFAALLDSGYAGIPANPADKNLAVYASGLSIDADLAYGDSGLFRQCMDGPTGCDGPVPGMISTCVGTSELAGTGMDVADAACGAAGQAGGGTGWAVIRGNVLRGETIELRLAIWDTGDETFDSDVVLDNFRWYYAPMTPGATTK